MSLTFAPAAPGERPASCSCEDAWHEMAEIAAEIGASVEPFDCPACRARLNINAHRGAELLAHVGLPAGGGRERAARVVELCEARLAQLEVEPGYPAIATTAGTTLGSREPGRLRDLTADLLAIARAAGGGEVVWW